MKKRKPKETIGRCEICGLVDHHLIAGECAECAQRYGHDLDGAALGGEADIRQADGGRTDRIVALDATFRNSPTRRRVS